MGKVKPLLIQTLPLDQLEAAPYNPRRISAEALAGLKASVRRFGLVEPIVWNKRTKHVVGGHQRITALREIGQTEAQVVIVDLPAREEKALNLALNNSYIAGEFTDGVADLVAEIGREAMGLVEELRLDQLVDMDALFPKEPVGETDPEAEPDRAEELREKWSTETGQLWAIGEHRVLCGDSTKGGDVERLMGGKRVAVLLTDPPYGVSYVGKTKDALKVENDDLGEPELEALIGAAFSLAEKHSAPGAYWYATVPAGPLHLLFALDWKARGILRQILVWEKDSMVLGHSEYHYKHEPILFGWVKGERFRNPDRTRVSVWHHDRPKASREHPTMKPVSLWEQVISDSSKPRALIYDPFLGSGTTIVAAQNLGRKAHGIEISPAYVAVTLERLSKMGLEPRLVD